MDTAGELRVLAPNPTYQRTLRVIFAVLAGIGVFVWLLTLAGGGHLSPAEGGPASTNPFIVGLYFLVMGVLGYAYLWLWHASTRLLIGPGVVGYQDLFGRRRFWSSSEIARAVQITIAYQSRRGYQLKRTLLLLGVDGQVLRKVRVEPWSEQDIDAFTAATGRTPEYLGSYTAKQAGSEFPGSVGWMYAHPSGALLVTAGIVIAVGALFEWWILSSRH